MSRIVFVTQRIDPADPVLAAAVSKITALARHVDEVSVLVLDAVPAGLPANVRVRTFGARSRIGRGLRFAAAVAIELRRRPDALIAHMSPIYAVLAAPLARPLGVRLVLWFTHWRRSALLRLAERVVDVVVSVDRRSFPLDSRKVRAIGHGIEVSEFPCVEARADGGPLRALALGRYSDAKGLDVVLRGVQAALDRGVDVELVVHGPATTDAEEAYRARLEQLAGELGLGGRARLEGPLRRAELPALFAETDVLVNNMRAGAPDKVVFEAAASCVPVLASNPVFDDFLDGIEPPLGFGRERPDELAQRLAALAALDPGRRAEIGRTLRRRVEAGHSADSWARGVLAAAGLE